MYKGDMNEQLQEHGEGLLTWPHVAIGKGTWINGELQGEGTLTLDNGLSFEGQWYKKIDGTMGMYVGDCNEHGPHGKGKLVWPTLEDSYQVECEWVDGVPRYDKKCVTTMFNLQIEGAEEEEEESKSLRQSSRSSQSENSGITANWVYKITCSLN